MSENFPKKVCFVLLMLNISLVLRDFFIFKVCLFLFSIYVARMIIHVIELFLKFISKKR